MSDQHLNAGTNNNNSPLLKSKPNLLYSGFISKDSSHYCLEHSHTFCEIAYICDGQGQFTIDGNTYMGRKGDILIYNSNTAHEEYSIPSDPLEMYYCAINNIIIEGLCPQNIIPETTSPIIKACDFTPMIENYFSAIIMESSTKLDGHEAICSSLLSSIIISILRFINIQENGIKEEINPLSGKSTQIYINQNYTQDINLSKLSKVFYMSKDYLSHVFKDEIGLSPIKYLINCRIEESKRLLISTDLSVNEISSCVGYDDANYFSTVFKKITGQSPTMYRKNNSTI